jgi:hypothetical protein
MGYAKYSEDVTDRLVDTSDIPPTYDTHADVHAAITITSITAKRKTPDASHVS